MSLDDLLEPEVLIVAGVTAAVVSPPVRKVLHKGAVLGLAGLLIAGDKIAAAARGIGQGAQRMASSGTNGTSGTTEAAAPATHPVPG